MKRSLGSHLALLTIFGIGSTLHPTIAQAFQFGDDIEIPDYQTRLSVMASPIGTTGSYKLIIFEQLNNRRQCWGEVGTNPTVIQPMFMDFDFTGICGRSTDSNAYSIRVGEQDLAGRYNLRLVRKANEVVLVGFSLTDRNLQFFEIGRTRGIAEGFLEIQLDPGWRLTRRSFQGKPVGHIYFATDRSLTDLANSATPLVPTLGPRLSQPSSSPRLSQPSSPPQSISPAATPYPPVTDPYQPQSMPPLSPATPPTSGGYVVPVVIPGGSSSEPSAAPKSLPSNWNNSNWNSRPQVAVVVPVISPTQSSPSITPPTPTPGPAPVVPPTPAAATTGFRVVVDLPGLEQQTQLRQLIPGAFRTTVDGRSVMQVGVFRDRATATSLQQQLASYNLNPRIVQTTIAALPQTLPSTNNSPILPATEGNRFNLPEPIATSATPASLWATYYYTHQAEALYETPGVTYPLLDLAGNNLGVNLSHQDWCISAVQGSVQIINAQQVVATYDFAGRAEKAQVNCAPFYPKLSTLPLTNRVRFKRSAALYGQGAGGNQLVPYRSVAVDKTKIPIGTVIYIPEARGTIVTLPSGQQAVHDGYFYSADVGAAVKGNQIDVYIGVSRQNPFRFVKSTPSATFTAYIINNPQVQAMLAAQHRSTSVASR